LITARGIGFLIAAIAVFWLGRLTQVGWLYLIDAVLWGLILLSAILPWLGASFLSAHRKVEHTGTPGVTPEGMTSGITSERRSGLSEGDPVEIQLTLQNRGFWPRFFINAHYSCPLAQPDPAPEQTEGRRGFHHHPAQVMQPPPVGHQRR
jgi:uncharacterized protein (DUF58 family)